MNISGNASGWVANEKNEKNGEEKTVKRKPLNITKELKSLKDLHEKLDVKHNESSNKDLYDALVDVYGAIRSLENIKN
jgi:hypothetical protein